MPPSSVPPWEADAWKDERRRELRVALHGYGFGHDEIEGLVRDTGPGSEPLVRVEDLVGLFVHVREEEDVPEDDE